MPENITTQRCGAYKEHWKYLGKSPNWSGCYLSKGHDGPHMDGENSKQWPSPEKQQPQPIGGQQDSTEALIGFLRKRQQLGIQKYGQSLHTFDGRNNVLDVLQESTDLVQYLFKEVLELLNLLDAMYGVFEHKVTGPERFARMVEAHLKLKQWSQFVDSSQNTEATAGADSGTATESPPESN